MYEGKTRGIIIGDNGTIYAGQDFLDDREILDRVEVIE